MLKKLKKIITYIQNVDAIDSELERLHKDNTHLKEKKWESSEEFKKEQLSHAEDNKNWATAYKELEQKVGNPATVVEMILRRPIKWYDYEQIIDVVEREKYKRGAEDLVRNGILINEKNAFISDLIQHIAKDSVDFQEVRDLRMSINGVEAFFERLESIQSPEEKSDKPSKPIESIDDMIQE